MLEKFFAFRRIIDRLRPSVSFVASYLLFGRSQSVEVRLQAWRDLYGVIWNLSGELNQSWKAAIVQPKIVACSLLISYS